MVQPIHQDDLTRCMLAALGRDWREAETIVVAGPAPVSYGDFVRAVARAAGLGAVRIVPVPVGLLMALSPVTVLPLLPRVRIAELRRLLEDKDFAIDAMVARLGVRPMGLTDGLGKTFA